ncbi:MAG: electron transfer flavoprotein subunit alpha/FixB family protein [Thermodesulfobacteriota bacterium]
MTKVGFLIEMKNGKVKPACLGVISAAHDNKTERVALLLEGGSAESVEILEAHGIQRVVQITSANGAIPWHAEQWAGAVVQAMEHFNIQTLMGLASAQGKNILSRVAARLGAPLVMDCTAVDLSDQTATKSQFSGKAAARFRTHGKYHLYGMRPNALDPVTMPGDAMLETFQAEIEETGITVLEVKKGASDLVDLTEADVIISGGRGMQNKDNFDILFKFAKQISAAVGASRVAVDAGWVSHTMQVGQTGKTVSPKVYIACGISGSVQHFAGMKTAGIIIAINLDPNAAIMHKCDYAVCADLFDVIPVLTRKLKEITA